MAMKCAISMLHVFAVLYMISCCLSTDARITDYCNKTHTIGSHNINIYYTCIFPNNHTDKFQCPVHGFSEEENHNMIILDGKTLDIDDPRVQIKDNIYSFDFTSTIELSQSQLQCVEQEDGHITKHVYNIEVEYKPLVQGNCSYSKENGFYLIDFIIISNPRLTLNEYGSSKFSVTNAEYDDQNNHIFGPSLLHSSNNTLTVQYQMTQQNDIRKNITVALQTSNKIGTSKSSAVCPAIAELNEINKLPEAGKNRVNPDCPSAGVRLPSPFLWLTIVIAIIIVFGLIIIIIVLIRRRTKSNRLAKDEPIHLQESILSKV